MQAYIACTNRSRTHTTYLDWINQTLFGHINTDTFTSQYKPQMECSQHHSMIEFTSRRFFIMDTTNYWPFAGEYSIWNPAVTALQFWTTDLDPLTFSNAIERVYTVFFCSDSAQHLRYISEEILFGCFVTTLHDAFEWKLALKDGRYESWSEHLNIPTPLHRAPCLYHISTYENLSFGTATPRAHPSPNPITTVHCCFMFRGDKESSPNRGTLHPRMEHHSPVEHPMACHFSSIEEDEEEYFPTAPLNDYVWMEEPVLDRHLSIHEDSQHDLWPYPCPYSLDQLHLTPQYMNLSDIFYLPDVITTASDEDIPNLEDILQL